MSQQAKTLPCWSAINLVPRALLVLIRLGQDNEGSGYEIGLLLQPRPQGPQGEYSNMASRMRSFLRRANRINDTLLPQFENLKQRKLGRSAYNVYFDYKTVFKESIIYVKEKPLRSVLSVACVGTACYVYDNNPDEQSFTDTLVESSNKLLQLSDLIRSPSSCHSLQHLLKLHSEGCLRRQSLGLFSIVLKQNLNSDCDLYENQCTYVQPRWTNLWSRVVDIGVMGHWVMLERFMINYDVNEEELVE